MKKIPRALGPGSKGRKIVFKNVEDLNAVDFNLIATFFQMFLRPFFKCFVCFLFDPGAERAWELFWGFWEGMAQMIALRGRLFPNFWAHHAC